MIRLLSTLIAFFLLANTPVAAQFRSIQVNYTFKSRFQSETVTFYKTLFDDGLTTIFFDNDTIQQPFQKIQVIKKDTKKNKGFFYSKQDNEGIYYAPVFGKDFYVKEDSLPSLLAWEFIPGEDTVLGYSCKKATCTFRGRKYIACYAESIPFHSGPWKFMGLPGLILKIGTEDESFRYEAIKFVGLPNKVEIERPYGKAEFLSFVDYKKLYLKKLADHQQKVKSEEKDADVDINIKDTSMELLK